jgi:hypothetical protein
MIDSILSTFGVRAAYCGALQKWVIAAAGVLLTMTATAAHEPPPVRAWLLTRGNTAAVLVGESHVYTGAEFDNYYQRIVKPSFEAARLALLESHFDEPDLVTVANARTLPCAAAGERLSDALKPKLVELGIAIRQSKLDVPVWITQFDKLPEPLLASQIIDFTASDVRQALQATDYPRRQKLGVSFQLAAGRQGAGRSGPTLAALDTVAKLREQFCGSPSDVRQDVLAGLVDVALGKLRLLEDIRSTGSAQNIEQEMTRSWSRVLACVDSAKPCSFTALLEGPTMLRYGLLLSPTWGYFKLQIHDRTQAWVPLIDEAIKANRRVFIAAGSLHLPDLRFADQVYPGLLTQLRQRGYTVKPISEESDIQESFLRRRWWERWLLS